MSSIRRHSCITLAPPQVPSVKRRITLPRRVITSDGKLKNTSKRTAQSRCRGSLRDGATRAAPLITKRTNFQDVVDNRMIAKTSSESKLKEFTVLPENTILNEVRTIHSNIDYTNNLPRNDEINITHLEPIVEECFSNSKFTSLDPVKKDTILSTAKTTPHSRAAYGTRTNCSNKKLTEKSYVYQIKQTLLDDLSDVSEFRDRYFFQCHSAEAMLRQKPSVLLDANHRCNYRFYLNERLFPVPLHSDHENTVRCSDCHLPVELNPLGQTRKSRDTINGTIQAKVRVGSDRVPKDMVLLLPVDTALVTEKFKNTDDLADEDIMHFGILKIDNRRSAMKKQFAPQDSFALRYQKGYHEFEVSKAIRFGGHKKDDIIIL